MNIKRDSQRLDFKYVNSEEKLSKMGVFTWKLWGKQLSVGLWTWKFRRKQLDKGLLKWKFKATVKYGNLKMDIQRKNSQIWEILEILRKESVRHLQIMQSKQLPQLQPVQSQNLWQTFSAFLICPQFFSYFQSFQSSALWWQSVRLGATGQFWPKPQPRPLRSSSGWKSN